MSGAVINLRTERKKRERAERERTADANRALHGRTKGEKQAAARAAETAARLLDGHKRTPERD